MIKDLKILGQKSLPGANMVIHSKALSRNTPRGFVLRCPVRYTLNYLKHFFSFISVLPLDTNAMLPDPLNVQGN